MRAGGDELDPFRMPEKFFQWIRSSDMSYVKMLIHESALHDFVDKIGTMNNVQFTDVGSDHVGDYAF